MVSALNSGLKGSGSSPGWGHGVVFLGKTKTKLYSFFNNLYEFTDEPTGSLG